MFNDLLQWLSETLDLLLMDKTGQPYLTMLLIGRISFLGLIIGTPIVIAISLYNGMQWFRSKRHGAQWLRSKRHGVQWVRSKRRKPRKRHGNPRTSVRH